MLTGFICADNTDPLCFKFALQSPVAQMISHSSVLKWLLFPLFLLCGFEAHAAVGEVLTQPATDSQKSVFRRTLREALARSSDAIGVPGADGWIFFDKELLHLGSPCFWSVSPTAASSSTNPLPAILDFKSQLDKVGVELLVVPVPTKAAIYPDKLCSAVPAPPSTPSGLADQDAAFLKLLASQGVKVLDLTEPFLRARQAGIDTHCRTDTHWSPEGIKIAAQHIAAVASVPKEQRQATIQTQSAPLKVQGDLAPPGTPPEVLQARFITQTGGEAIPPSKSSPIVLLGDSHNLVFHAGGVMHATGAGLPDQMSYEFGFPMDVVAVMGSGATPARRSLARRKDNLSGKKLVVWCFSSREFTQGQGWELVKVIKDNTTPPMPQTQP